MNQEHLCQLLETPRPVMSNLLPAGGIWWYRELHRAGTTGWLFPPGPEPTAMSAALFTEHTSEDFLKSKQTQ